MNIKQTLIGTAVCILLLALTVSCNHKEGEETSTQNSSDNTLVYSEQSESAVKSDRSDPLESNATAPKTESTEVITGEQPTTGSDAPETTNHSPQPPATAGKPITGGAVTTAPPVTEATRPTTNKTQPPHTTAKPTTTAPKPATQSPKPVTTVYVGVSDNGSGWGDLIPMQPIR